MKKIGYLLFIGIITGCSNYKHNSLNDSNENLIVFYESNTNDYTKFRNSLFQINFSDKHFFWAGCTSDLACRYCYGEIFKLNDTTFVFKSVPDINNVPVIYTKNNKEKSIANIEPLDTDNYNLQTFNSYKKEIIFNNGDTMNLTQRNIDYGLKGNSSSFRLRVGLPEGYRFGGNFKYIQTEEISVDSLKNYNISFKIGHGIDCCYEYINDTLYARKDLLYTRSGFVFKKIDMSQDKLKKQRLGYLFKSDIDPKNYKMGYYYLLLHKKDSIR